MSAAGGLVARTRRLDQPVDLAAFAGSSGILFERGRAGFAARGVALRTTLDQVAADLAAIGIAPHTAGDDGIEPDRPGTGPVAFGALPFRPGDPAELVVPAAVVGRAEDGTRWLTVVGPGPEPPVPPVPAPGEDGAAGGAPPADGPSAFEVASSRPPDEWKATVAAATKRIAGGELDKVVLAREVVVSADRPIPVDQVIARLRHAYPGCYVFSVDGLVGASPELLVARSGDIVRAQPMAGTAPRRGDPTADARLAAALLASPTYRHEHQVTIDMVHDTLLGFSSYVDYEAEPSVVALANVAHLATTVEGRLSRPAASVLDLVGALHPTPAVCGRPRDAALGLIAEIEGLERGRYAGTVGWVDARGNGEWAVSIRCAEIAGPVARVYAGNGIVASSDPDLELAETRSKLQAMLGALVRP